MSSINPISFCRARLRAGLRQLVRASPILSHLWAGQFCTNPGLVIAIEGPDLERFIESTTEALATKPAQTMLTPGIFDAFRAGTEMTNSVQGVTRVAQSEIAGTKPNYAEAVLYVTDARRLLASPDLQNEMFGPTSIVVRARDFDEMLKVADHVEGQLTVTLQIDAVDHPDAQRLLPVLERKAGCILVNGFPTGVEVCHAVVHDGPFPSTSNSMFTSVGASAIDRFIRPVCYQDLPDSSLPPALQESNPLEPWRVVDGEVNAPSNSLDTVA